MNSSMMNKAHNQLDIEQERTGANTSVDTTLTDKKPDPPNTEHQKSVAVTGTLPAPPHIIEEVHEQDPEDPNVWHQIGWQMDSEDITIDRTWFAAGPIPPSEEFLDYHARRKYGLEPEPGDQTWPRYNRLVRWDRALRKLGVDKRHVKEWQEQEVDWNKGASRRDNHSHLQRLATQLRVDAVADSGYLPDDELDPLDTLTPANRKHEPREINENLPQPKIQIPPEKIQTGRISHPDRTSKARQALQWELDQLDSDDDNDLPAGFSKHPSRPWTKEDEEHLFDLIEGGERDFSKLARQTQRTVDQCHRKYRYLASLEVEQPRVGNWTAEQDAMLVRFIEEYKITDWDRIAFHCGTTMDEVQRYWASRNVSSSDGLVENGESGFDELVAAMAPKTTNQTFVTTKPVAASTTSVRQVTQAQIFAAPPVIVPQNDERQVRTRPTAPEGWRGAHAANVVSEEEKADEREQRHLWQAADRSEYVEENESVEEVMNGKSEVEAAPRPASESQKHSRDSDRGNSAVMDHKNTENAGPVDEVVNGEIQAEPAIKPVRESQKRSRDHSRGDEEVTDLDRPAHKVRRTGGVLIGYVSANTASAAQTAAPAPAPVQTLRRSARLEKRKEKGILESTARAAAAPDTAKRGRKRGREAGPAAPVEEKVVDKKENAADNSILVAPEMGAKGRKRARETDSEESVTVEVSAKRAKHRHNQMTAVSETASRTRKHGKAGPPETAVGKTVALKIESEGSQQDSSGARKANLKTVVDPKIVTHGQKLGRDVGSESQSEFQHKTRSGKVRQVGGLMADSESKKTVSTAPHSSAANQEKASNVPMLGPESSTRTKKSQYRPGLGRRNRTRPPKHPPRH